MKSLKELIAGAFPDYPHLASIPEIPIRGIVCDSRKVEKDTVFVAIRGVKNDGRLFIHEALDRGAAAIVSDSFEDNDTQKPFIWIADTRLAVAKLAASYYDRPDKDLTLIGITGTNGKTTSSFLIEHLLRSAQKSVGVIGTINYRFAGKQIPALETTPGPLNLHALLAEMRDAHCRYVAMEVSAHALDQQRVAGIDFSVALFTNLTQDHLDYFHSMDDYFKAKARLLTGLAATGIAVINKDDPRVRSLEHALKAKVTTFGIHEDADLRAVDIQARADQTRFTIIGDQSKIEVTIPLIGLHNVYNVLGALGVCQALGLDLRKAAVDLTLFAGVPGRLESITAGQDFSVLVDYAHTPDGLENVLLSLKPYKKNKLIVVFGCGGERDKDKRPIMGSLAAEHADFVYLTSDNPRSEDPKTIADEVRRGMPENFKDYSVVIDRRKAVRQALLAARTGDIVLLAGKGHETTQVIAGQTLPYNDGDEARRVLNGF